MNNIKEIKCNITGDMYYKVHHKSGLTIYIYPKEGFKSTYALFGAKYGSINTTFKKDNGEEITVPDGIAHYLEHKLFESEDGDAFVKYAKQEHLQMLILHLTKPAICFRVQIILTNL